MVYISGEYALNVPCKLNTTGDWHKECYSLDKALILESDETIFENFGIEKHIIDNKELWVADHIRAILDIMIYGNIDFLYGFKRDFICVDEYDNEIFNKVYRLKNLLGAHINKNKWYLIDNLMNNEYKMKWVKYKERKGAKYG